MLKSWFFRQLQQELGPVETFCKRNWTLKKITVAHSWFAVARTWKYSWRGQNRLRSHKSPMFPAQAPRRQKPLAALNRLRAPAQQQLKLKLIRNIEIVVYRQLLVELGRLETFCKRNWTLKKITVARSRFAVARMWKYIWTFPLFFRPKTYEEYWNCGL